MSSLKVTREGERHVRIERVFDAPRERVWDAFSRAEQLVQWWGRGNPLDIERFEFRKGGHWRWIEHAPKSGAQGFEGRYAEIVARERIVNTFEWDGMPGHVSLQSVTFEDAGDGRTRVVTSAVFMAKADCDGMMASGMEGGLAESYAALDALLRRRSP